jgi:hypothetical protein
LGNGGISIQSTSNVNGREKVEFPKLPDDPTEDDLLHYAESHPAIRKVMDLFKASIVEVSKVD